MSEAVPLLSDGRIGSIEQHFRVSAGPGAGKTHWLCEHIRRVVRESDRLCPSSRILCISYTNVAVAELAGRIGSCSDRAEVCTIHAFLYKHLLRPYAHLLKKADGTPLLDHASIEGHDEHSPTYPRVEAWLKAAGVKGGAQAKLLGDWPGTQAALKRVRWSPQPDGTWALVLPPGARPNFFPSTHLDGYKQPYWDSGIVDHDDVIHLSRMILAENPQLASFVSARFPYVFIDEFQDTHPAQTELVKRLAASGSIVGVIGDVQQSIYGFQNARPEDFAGLSLPGMVDYHIYENRRTTVAISTLLNAARKDPLVQTSLRCEQGLPVTVLVGPHDLMLAEARRSVREGERVVALCYRNESVAALRRAVGVSDPWPALELADSNRARFLERLLQGSELARGGQFPLAVHKASEAVGMRRGELSKPLSSANRVEKVAAQGLALTLLECIHRLGGDLTLLETYAELTTALQAHPGVNLRAVRAGGFQRQASAIKLADLRVTLHTPEARADVSTIHNAKGAEFDHVAVFFSDSTILAKALDATQADREELRVHYVGMSRARNLLFLCIPDAPSSQLSQTLIRLGAELRSLFPPMSPGPAPLQGTLFSDP